MPKNDERKPVRCSFCGKHQEQVSRIIAGPAPTSATSASTCA